VGEFEMEEKGGGLYGDENMISSVNGALSGNSCR
jgi:hypothetical protein